MSNIEKIRQEVDMYIKSFELNGGIYDSYEAGELSAYKEILDFIDSQPEEKPSEDLEEEIQGMYQAIFGTDIINRREMVYLETFDMIARHFAEWQKGQMMKEAVNAEITVGRLPDDWSLAYNPDELHRALLKFKSGDKVKIIIVKQDDRPRD